MPETTRRTLLVGLSHPDDEVGCLGAIAAQVAKGDRVVIVWLTRGAMTEALGPLPGEEVARRREEQGFEVAAMLGAEARFLDFEDTWVEATAENAHRAARVIAEMQPDALLTWGDAWRRGMRHPDHQATGKILRDAVTLARVARAVAPLPPHRGPCPVFTLREEPAVLPAAAVDVTPYQAVIHGVAAYYRARVDWPPDAWLRERLAAAGARWGVTAAEEFDAWETPGGLFTSLI
ncbi:MAG TPA: PIG-L family deacetylase [Longimicrobiales bacterium]|nr:PIG-L family deacetylase [Longimicrobiales bacterium]